MTPNAQEIYTLLHENESIISDEVYMSAVKNSKFFLASFRELVFSNEDLKKRIFLMSFNETEKKKIIAAILGIAVNTIDMSPMKRETIRFSGEIIVCEALAEIYSSLSKACSIDKEEFCLIWDILNTSGSFGEMLWEDKSLHPIIEKSLFEALKASKEKTVIIGEEDEIEVFEVDGIG